MDYLKEFWAKLQNLDKSKTISTVFEDFLRLTTYSLSQTIIKNSDIEIKYTQIASKYTKEQVVEFSKLLALLVDALEEKHQDFFGMVFSQLNLGNANKGQFFTPYHLSQFMAEINISDIEKQLEEKEYSIAQNLNFENITFIPHVDLKVSAGYGSIIDEINMTKDFMAFAKEWIFKNIHVSTENLVLFTVNGYSMDSPTSQIKDGGLILVDKSITEFKNDGVYVIALDDALYVKRLQILPGRKLKVKSDNINYDPFEVSLDTDNFHIVGKVIWAGSLLECIK